MGTYVAFNPNYGVVRSGGRSYNQMRAHEAFPDDAETVFMESLTSSASGARRRRTAEQIKLGMLWFATPDHPANTAKEQTDRHWWKTTFRFNEEEQCLYAVPTKKHSKERRLVSSEDFFNVILFEHDINGPRGHRKATIAILENYYGPTKSEVATLLRKCVICGKRREREYSEPKQEAPSGTLQLLSHGEKTLQGVPTYEDTIHNRRWQLQHMTAACHFFDRQGYAQGIWGGISVRDPEMHHAMWTAPMGVQYGLLQTSHFVCLNMDTGETIQGNLSKPVSATTFQLHRAIYQARSDVKSIVHASSVSGSTYSCFSKPLEMITAECCTFYGVQYLHPRQIGFQITESEARDVATSLCTGKALIVTHSGLLTVGCTIDESVMLFHIMERCCTAQLLADAAVASGNSKMIISHEEALEIFKICSDRDYLFASFQPEFRRIEAACNGEL